MGIIHPIQGAKLPKKYLTAKCFSKKDSKNGFHFHKPNFIMP